MKKIHQTEIKLPEGKSLKMTDENFLKLLTENKALRKKNIDLNKLVRNITTELDNLRAGVKS